MGRRSKKASSADLVPVSIGLFLVLVFFTPGMSVWLALGVLSSIAGLFVFIWHRTTNPEHKNEIKKAALGNCGISAPAAVPSLEFSLVERLRGIDWYQFEKIIAMAYRAGGFQVEQRGGANPDGGIDMILTDLQGERTALQCKQWRTWKVSVNKVREFIGAMKIAGIERGIFITLRGYTQDSREIAKSNGIELLDEAGLVRLLESSDCRFNPEFLNLITDKKKSCPKCDNTLILRTATKGSNAGGKFWGCSTYPRCHFTMQA